MQEEPRPTPTGSRFPLFWLRGLRLCTSFILHRDRPQSGQYPGPAAFLPSFYSNSTLLPGVCCLPSDRPHMGSGPDGPERSSQGTASIGPGSRGRGAQTALGKVMRPPEPHPSLSRSAHGLGSWRRPPPDSGCWYLGPVPDPSGTREGVTCGH